MASPARVVNRGIAIGASLIVLIGLSVGIFGDHANAPSDGSTWSTNSVPLTTIPNMTGARPANIDGSWFTANGASEQYDYPMEKLSCGQLENYLTTDLCGVANTSRGSMMFVATEGYWDPSEPDADGVVRIPLYFQVFIHTRAGGPARAASVLDGELFVEYETTSSTPESVSLSISSVAGDDIFLVEHTTTYDSTPFHHVQIIAMNSTGAPTLMAAYQGDKMRVAATSQALLITAHRYGPPSGGECCDDYVSIWTLTPATSGDNWIAVERSSSNADKELSGSVRPSLAGEYFFPQRYGTAVGA